MVVENTKCSTADIVQMFPLVRDLGIGKRQGLLLDLHYFIRIMDFTIAHHQRDFVKIPPLVGHGFCVVACKRFQAEYIEMPDFIANLFRHPIEFSLVEISKRFGFVHDGLFTNSFLCDLIISSTKDELSSGHAERFSNQNLRFSNNHLAATCLPGWFGFQHPGCQIDC